jgi:TctA family transporter
MNTQDNENFKRVAVLVVLLASMLTFVLLQRDTEGAIYILLVAAFSGLMSAWIFIDTSTKRIKDIAEQMSDDYQANTYVVGTMSKRS